jgi:hypothetical protein
MGWRDVAGEYARGVDATSHTLDPSANLVVVRALLLSGMIDVVRRRKSGQVRSKADCTAVMSRMVSSPVTPTA